MEKLCNDCVNYDEEYDDRIENKQDLIQKFNRNIKRQIKMYKPVDFNKLNRDLYQALLFPEFAKGFKCIIFFNF